jgi:ATP-dependent Clp protease ATP-binding subunit ClpA
MPTLESFRRFVFRSAATVPAWKRSVSALVMPERFSQDARMVSFVAHEIALRCGSNCVDGAHLVLALLDDHGALAVLQNAGTDLPALRRAMERRLMPAPEGMRRDAILPTSSGVHKAWADAHTIADGQGARSIEPEHLLRALVIPDGPLSNTTKDLIASGFGRA